MRTLSSALNTALGKAVTQPGWLVEILFSTPVRLSSRATVVWNGYTWVAADVSLSKVRVDEVSVVGQLQLGNTDDLFGTLVLIEGVSDKEIRLYGYDGNATALADVVYLANALGGRATVSPDMVTIDLRDEASVLVSPRAYVGPPTFKHLLPAGAAITLNGQTYRIERK